MPEGSPKRKGRRSLGLGPSSGSLPQLYQSGDLPAEPTPLPVPDLPVGNLELLPAEDERRRQPRKSFPRGLRVTINGQQYACRGVDVSRGGASFRPVPPGIKKGDPVLLDLVDPPRRMLGRVAWFQPLQDGTPDLLIGVRFSRPLAHSLDGEEA